MIYIVTSENEPQYREEMEQVFRLRHKVFVEEKHWTDLAKSDGREVDQFDDGRAVHMLYLQQGRVIGYQRMLPTTRPHLLSDVMPQLCEGERPVGPDIWEWSRYCVDPAHRERGRVVSPVGLALVQGFVEWGLRSVVSTIVAQANPHWLLRLLQVHFRPVPLGLPQRIGGEEVIAYAATFDRQTLTRLKGLRGDARSVLAPVREPVGRLVG